MKAKIPHMPDHEMDITPMVDIIFLLIIFFMIVAAEITEKVPIEVPEADRAQVPSETGRRLEISILESGDFYKGLQKINLEQINQLINNGKQFTDFKVYIRADINTPHRHVKEVMTKCAENGIDDIIFGALQDK